MSFIWPHLLWLLLLLPLAVWAYRAILERKKRLAVRYASLSMIREAMGGGPSYRRHLPAALLLVALFFMILAVARPTATLTVPSQRDSVILAMDISGSMRAVDVDPDRLTASKEAVKTFINEQPSATKIGIVAFAGTAMMVQQPTLDRAELIAAVDRFQLQRGTNIGSALRVSLQEIFPEANFGPENDGPQFQSGNQFGGSRFQRGRPLGIQDDVPEEEEEFVPVEPGSYTNAAIVLLTDGQATTGPDPIEIARMAADRGVRVFTVGFGTAAGETVGYGGMSMRVQLDEETLRQISEITRGRYFQAASSSDLTEVYRELTARFVMETEQTEVTAFFAGAAAILIIISSVLSLLWFTRII